MSGIKFFFYDPSQILQLSEFVPTLGTLGKGHAAEPGQGGYEI